MAPDDPGLRVSIILPVYNGAQHLRQSIDSCLQQTHRNIELVIVDDCSTDATPNIISEYLRRDPRIISVRNIRNLHLPGALNVGFAHANGDLLTWTSHDNYYASTAIETLVRQLCSRQEVDLVYSAFRHVDEHGRVDPDIVYLPPPWRLPFINAVGACFLYRRAVYEKTGEYREDMEYEEDYEYWLRVRRHFNIMRLNFPLYYYRLGGSMAAHYQRHPELWGKARRAHSKQGTYDCC